MDHYFPYIYIFYFHKNRWNINAIFYVHGQYKLNKRNTILLSNFFPTLYTQCTRKINILKGKPCFGISHKHVFNTVHQTI